MASNDKSNFYDEVLRALWGYVSDKLNIPVSQLTKDNISERLQSHAVDESLIAEFLQLMSDCEFERFAPANSGVGMAQIYEKALQVITKMEDSIV